MSSDSSSKTAVQGLIYELPSILEPIELAKLFQEHQPLEIELGSGDGSFLVEYAQCHREQNFIGIERLLGRLRKLNRKGRLAGLTNLRGIRIESSYFLRYLLPAHSVRALHIYFPDPWPKRKHQRHRLINEEFPVLAHRALQVGGNVLLRTDDHDYFEQMLAVFGKSPLFGEVAIPQDVFNVLTDFERDFCSRGIETRRAAYQAKR